MSSSEDEGKRKYSFGRKKPKKAVGKNALTNSMAMPTMPSAQRRSIKDVSFKSNNISTHTDTSERLKENLRLFKQNRLTKKKTNNV